MCLGAATTTSATDDTACTCFSAVNTANTNNVLTTNACDISVYPQVQSEWRRVRAMDNPDLGDTDTDMQGVAVIDPKRGNITQSADAGNIKLRAPSGSLDFRLNVNISRNGRAVICEPSAAPAKLPQYANRHC